MALAPIIDKAESSRAFGQMSATLHCGAQRCWCTVGYQGGNGMSSRVP